MGESFAANTDQRVKMLKSEQTRKMASVKQLDKLENQPLAFNINHNIQLN